MQKIEFFIGEKNKEIMNKAKKLGFQEILFVKEVQDLKEIKKEVQDLKEIKKEVQDKYNIILIKTENVELLRRMIDKAAGNFKVFVLGSSDIINRVALESKKVFALVNPERDRFRDYMDYRNSGLNHVLCKIARDNKKMILFPFSSLIEKYSFGRVIQNIKLCNKFKVDNQIVNFSSNIENFRSFYDLKLLHDVLARENHFEYDKLKDII